MKLENLYGIVMAGGRGERFWPQSRASHPKQLLRLIGNLTLIEQTVERLMPLIKPENIIIITNQDYIAPMRSLLASIPPENIVGEPVGRDTAPCIALASALVKAKAKREDAIMAVLPSDHVIRDTSSMLQVISDSVEAAKKGKVVTIGVNPSFPSTGYGYIHCGAEIKYSGPTKFFECNGFKEKPSLEVAEKFLQDSSYKWNSGMFIWSLSTICNAFKKYAPAMMRSIDVIAKSVPAGTLEKTLVEEYPKFDKISIDYSIMERIDNVVVAQCSFDWDDVGSWTALRNQIRPEKNNNVIRGLHEGIDTKNCIIVGDSKHLIATVDLEDVVVVHTDDATLICNAKSVQKIKELVHIIAARPELSKFI
ncbi:MAG: hypothetical protein A2017_21660 [Lentisphaerae bacterium GWF2_44_16]|nr:MAG: hypothetical protein A2017_21660 [Lentisphaerae bacterium GWF2_44_16]